MRYGVLLVRSGKKILTEVDFFRGGLKEVKQGEERLEKIGFYS